MADKEIDSTKIAEYVRNELLGVIRAEIPKTWAAMNEGEQERLAARIEYLTKEAVRRAVWLISKAGTDTVGAVMGPLGTDKNGNAKTTITFQTNLSDADKLAIWDHIGRNVVVVLMDPEAYMKMDKYPVDKDEPPLPLPQQPQAPAPQEAKQPDWPVVSAAVKRTSPPDDEDAHLAEDDDDDLPPPAPADDLLDEEMDDSEAAKLVNLPNPTKPKAAAKK